MRLRDPLPSLLFAADAPLPPEARDPRRWSRTEDGALRLELAGELYELRPEEATAPEPNRARHEAPQRGGLLPITLAAAPRVARPRPRRLSTAHAGSPGGARSTRAPLPAPEQVPGRVGEVALARVDPPPPPPFIPTLFDLRARAPSPEAEQRLDRRSRGPGTTLFAGSSLLLETAIAPLPAGRARLAIQGDQLLRVILTDREERPLLDQVLTPGAVTLPLPAGTRRALAIGLGRPSAALRPAMGAGYAWTTPMIRLGPASFAVPGAVLIAKDAPATGPVAPPESVTRGAPALELHLAAPVSTLALVLARSGGEAAENRKAATVRARDAELGPRSLIERGDELVWLFPIAPPAEGAPRPVVTVTLGAGWWARAIVGRRESLPALVPELRLGTWRPLEEPRDSDLGVSVVRVERVQP